MELLIYIPILTYFAITLIHNYLAGRPSKVKDLSSKKITPEEENYLLYESPSKWIEDTIRENFPELESPKPKVEVKETEPNPNALQIEVFKTRADGTVASTKNPDTLTQGKWNMIRYETAIKIPKSYQDWNLESLTIRNDHTFYGSGSVLLLGVFGTNGELLKFKKSPIQKGQWVTLPLFLKEPVDFILLGFSGKDSMYAYSKYDARSLTVRMSYGNLVNDLKTDRK